MPGIRQSVKAIQEELREEQAVERRRRETANNPKYNRIQEQFPDDGPYRREGYKKHLEFFRAGRDNRERCFMAANRVGKSTAGAYEATLHLTGLYPHWWEGRRFDGPVNGWVVGETIQTTRDILQTKLLGRLAPSEGGPNDVIGLGTGMIPGRCILDTKKGAGGAIEMAWIRHSSGRTSVLEFKSYAQGRESFAGTEQHFVWLDEECPMDIYTECRTRTMTTRGIVWLTFTPLKGLTEVVLNFLPAGKLD
jgi:phage terminase large subunit-like protein